jgi:hypothetical protein
MPPTHRCIGCGRSCTGSRVVPVDADEAARIERLAAELGVPRPLSNGALRRNMGRCCLWSPEGGCALHAAYGAAAKPAVCRQFPFVRAGERIDLDPACPHHLAGEGPTVPVRGLSQGREALPDTLEAQLAHVGLEVAELAGRWARHPWVPWEELADLGPHLRAALPRLRACVGPSVVPRWTEGARRVSVAWELGLVAPDDLADLVAGAVMVAARPDRRELLAAWCKLLR